MADPEQRSAGRPVAAVERALAVLDALAEHPEGLGVNELARRLAVNASSASRLLGTLEAGGLVERAPNAGPYRLGLRLVALADGVLARLDVRELARPRLRALVDETGETATLSIPGDPDPVTVDFLASDSGIVSLARLGRPSIRHATAVGKAMLAFGDARVTPPLEPFTDRTVTDPSALDAELEAARARGWTEALGEREPDLNAIAAPVVDRTGQLAAILGLQGPAARLTDERRDQVAPSLLAAAAELSRALGARG
jgi:DNA-binding IclR family transcriptional regulator